MFIQRTKDQILVDAIARIKANAVNKFSMTSGTVARQIAEIVATEIARIGEVAAAEILNKTLDSATGTYLDAYGVLFGISRVSNNTANDTTNANIKIYIDPAFGYTASSLVGKITATADTVDTITGSFTIKAGTILVTNKTGVYFRTTTDVNMSGTDTYCFVSAIAETAGTVANIASNGIIAHTIAKTQPELSEIADYLFVTNITPIDNGQEQESDVSYRARLRNAITSAASGNEISLRMAALSIPGVANVTLIKYIDGLGSTGIKVTGTNPIMNIGTLRMVRDACMKVVSVGETIRVLQPEFTQVVLTVELVPFQDTISDTAKDDIKKSIVDYIINIPEGGTIIYNQLISLCGIGSNNIKDASVTSMQIGDFDLLSGSSLNLYPIAPGNVTSGTSEKWYVDTSLVTVIEVG